VSAAVASIDDAAIAAIVDGIAAYGFAVAREFLPASDVDALRAQLIDHDRAGALAPAAVGRGALRATRGDIRGDRIRWIGAEAPAPAERRLLGALVALRIALNRELQLGLIEHEAHYALYPPGSGYAPHVDRFRDDDARVLSLVLYLNEQWRAEEGSALRLATTEDGYVEVLPEGGTLVTFLSERFPHEVQPATRERMSIAGWFRRRA
jgi:SM-20-related protein